MTYTFSVAELRQAKQLVRDHHYSGLTPNNVVLCGTWHAPGGLFGDFGPAVAACMFGSPPARWSEPVLELVRLVRAPDCDQPLSGLVSACVRWIKRHRMGDLLVSYADSTQDHHGGIYQACSWRYNGMRPPSKDGFVVNGKFIANRAMSDHFGTKSEALLTARGIEFVRHWDNGKHLYWVALTKQGKAKAARLGLRDMAYPKPSAASALGTGQAIPAAPVPGAGGVGPDATLPLGCLPARATDPT